MDFDRFNNAITIVPTRSLQASLQLAIASHNMQQGEVVWESPQILTWRDFVSDLFAHNQKLVLAQTGVHTILNNQQSLLTWTRVIEAAKHGEQEFALLNVQQTAKAAQRSWRLMHDWQVSPDELKDCHVVDAVQFYDWSQDYQQRLLKRGHSDDSLFQQQLAETLEQHSLVHPKQKVICYAFDLVTDLQKRILESLEKQGFELEFLALENNQKEPAEYQVYNDQKQELLAAMQTAKNLVEKNPEQQINLIVPDLQQRIATVRRLAAEVFYPQATPLELQNNDLVYRFSLGDSLAQWPAIETALTLIKSLNGSLSFTEFTIILRSEFLFVARSQTAEISQFLLWLQQQRRNKVVLSEFLELVQQWLLHSELQQSDSKLFEFSQQLHDFYQQLLLELQQNAEQHGFKAMTVDAWGKSFDAWLQLWGWSTSNAESFDTVAYQLRERWHSLIKEFVLLNVVQSSLGLKKAIELIHQLAREAVFLPKAASATPILIAGVFEAIGRPADLCIVTGMDENYPSLTQPDPFLATQLKQHPNYPDSNPVRQVNQAKQVIASLLSSATATTLSYAKSSEANPEVTLIPSPIFRHQTFEKANCDFQSVDSKVNLESYFDDKGQQVEQAFVKGGSQIFADQSNCAFRAFANHRLKIRVIEEAEFGLDYLDRGNLVHQLLDFIWEKLGTQQQLADLNQNDRLLSWTTETVDDFLHKQQQSSELNQTKQSLVQLERQRLISLLQEWLPLELKRPQAFKVVEREKREKAQVGGIHFHYIIDRVDQLEDGSEIIIDYKTGSVDRKDWQLPRLRQPQLPLYSLVQSSPNLKGIAWAQLKRHQMEYKELSESNIFSRQARYAEKYQQQWQQDKEIWPEEFEQLAADFIQGEAVVNPIDDSTCSYCQLQPLCRISQLKKQSDNSDLDEA